MKVSDLAVLDAFTAVTGDAGLSNDITGVYAGDLLSWVMSKAKAGDCWVTIQGHVNISAVAALTGSACIIVAENAPVGEDARQKSAAEGTPILRTALPMYDVCKLLAGLLG
jgi:hypothetical protein